MNTLFRRVPKPVKNATPELIKAGIKRGARRVLRSRYLSSLYLKDWAEVTNVYHCCTHKSASQWVRALLSDVSTLRHSGLDHFHYQTEWREGRDPRPVDERFFSEAFPERTIASPLYLHYRCFKDLPKPDRYRAFFVLRDPRDVVVSFYFSMKHSHPLNPGVECRRAELQKRSKTDGLCFLIEQMADYGFFQAQRSWVGAEDPDVRVFRYEDLTGPNQFEEVRRLFRFCTIPMPDPALRRLLHRHAFERKSGGREKGQEDIEAHQRKGVAGDWKNHFTERVAGKFAEETGDLVDSLGYEEEGD